MSEIQACPIIKKKIKKETKRNSHPLEKRIGRKLTIQCLAFCIADLFVE